MGKPENILRLSGLSLLTIKEDDTIIDADWGAIDIFELDGVYSKPEELESKKLFNMMSLRDAERKSFLENIERMQLNKLFAEERDIRTLKGNQKKIQINYLKIINEEKETSVKVLTKDVTKLRASEQNLQNINIMYRTLIGAAPIGIMLIDKDGVIKEFNSYLVNMFGAKSEEEFIDKNIFSFAGLQEINFLSEVKTVIKDKKPAAGEKRYVTNYGKSIYFSYVLVPIFINKESTEVSAFGIIEDRTKIRELADK